MMNHSHAINRSRGFPPLRVATACRHNAHGRGCGKAQPQHSALPGTLTSMKTPPSDPSEWSETLSHAVVGSTPAPGVVFRALAENRARRGVSSVCVKFGRTTANCTLHSAPPGIPVFASPICVSSVLRGRASASASVLSYFKLI